MLNKIVILFPSISLSLSFITRIKFIPWTCNTKCTGIQVRPMPRYEIPLQPLINLSPLTREISWFSNSILPSNPFPIFVLIYLQYEYRVTLSPNELKINSKLGGKYVGQECGELCNPLLVRRKLLGKSCRDGCNVYIYFFYALQFFTSTFINSKRDKNS